MFTSLRNRFLFIFTALAVLMLYTFGVQAQPLLLPDNPPTVPSYDWQKEDPLAAPKVKDDGTVDWSSKGGSQKVDVTTGSNSGCNVADMQRKYQSSCYSCLILNVLITTFMDACAKLYDLTREAAVKIMAIAALFWLASFAIKNVSSFTAVEPMKIVNDLLVFFFKFGSAYIVINSGIGAIVDLLINPVLVAGADYGLGIMKAANLGVASIPETTSYAYQGSEVVSATVINKIMALTQGIDKTVSNNLVIGHALTCHSLNAGMISFEIMGITFHIPDFWIWICGAAIWCVGFMLTLGVGYYLLDVSFKVGFAILALPIVIGLWPFKPTEKKFFACMGIVLKSAALFAFLSITASYGLILISSAIRDLPEFFDRINKGDAQWISDTFAITGSYFIILMFAYIYAFKLVGATVTAFCDKFFKDSIFGSQSPMHGKMTQMTDFVKDKVGKVAGFAGDVVSHQAGRMVDGAVNKGVGFAKNHLTIGKGIKSAGQAAKTAGQTAKTAGQAAEATGKGMEAAGKGISAAGKGLASASQAANAIPVVGQVVAAAGAAAGAAMQAAGAATQAAGKATQAAGKAVKAAGNAVKKAGDTVKNAGNKLHERNKKDDDK